jgi:hypothetical protein
LGVPTSTGATWPRPSVTSTWPWPAGRSQRKLSRLLLGFLETEVLPQATRAADQGIDPTPLLSVVSGVLRLYADALEHPEVAGH